MNQSMNYSMSDSINTSIRPSIPELISESMNRSITESINHWINQSINQSINQIIHSVNQLINQPINQSINQSMNQSSAPLAEETYHTMDHVAQNVLEWTNKHAFKNTEKKKKPAPWRNKHVRGEGGDSATNLLRTRPRMKRISRSMMVFSASCNLFWKSGLAQETEIACTLPTTSRSLSSTVRWPWWASHLPETNKQFEGAFLAVLAFLRMFPEPESGCSFNTTQGTCKHNCFKPSEENS